MNRSTIRLGGGLVTVASPLGMEPGELIGSENFECRIDGGYTRVKGYERFDGQPQPSEVVYTAFSAASWHADAVVGATLTGVPSGATGVISYSSGTLRAVTSITGTFTNGEDLNVGAQLVASAVTKDPTLTGAQDNAIHAASATILRADIGAVPGSGAVCGVCVIDDVVYAFRNNAGGTKQVVWKATASGWAAITYPTVYVVGFSAGSGTFDGLGAVTITQGANTANALKCMIQSGTFAGTNATGVFVLNGASSPGALTSGAATLSGGVGTVTLQTGHYITYQEYELRPSGKWKFVPYQFGFNGLNSTTVPVYGVDWVDSSNGGNFIEFNGLYVAPIYVSNFLTRYAERLECHKDHAFIAVSTSLYFSGLGDPYQWNVTAGGGEVVVGEPVTEIASIQGNENQSALLVCCENRIDVIYGNDSLDWDRKPLSREVGARIRSVQQIAGATLAFDAQGVRDIRPSQNFGNFSFNTLTNRLRNKVTDRVVSSSVLDRNGGHYRVFFEDGQWLSGVPGKKGWYWTINQFPIVVRTASSWEIAGSQRIFFTSDDGYLYEMDAGRSFDGDTIDAWFKTAYAHLGSPGERKAFRWSSIEIRSETVGTASIQPDYAYGATTIDQPDFASVANGALTGSDGSFDLGDWDVGTWDAAYMTELRVRSPGTGENVAILFYSTTDGELPVDATAITHFYLKRRQSR